jgi:hypothetical protein
LAVAVAAAVAVVAIDAMLYRLVPPDAKLLQAEQGLRDLQVGNPQVVLIGSSHARSFRPMNVLLGDSTVPPATRPFAIIPEEGGLFQRFEWLYDRRVTPLLDERDASGAIRRNRVKELYLITTYYDTCPATGEWDAPLASHGWTASDFLGDVWHSGLTPKNRNFLRGKWNELFPWSVLVQDRGVDRIRTKLRWHLPGREARQAAFVDHLREAMQVQDSTCYTPESKASFERMLASARARGLQTTVVVFPMDPALLTETGRRILARYSSYVASLQPRLGFRLLDYAANHEFAPTDFMDDLDHMTPAASRRFCAWLLAHDLRGLRSPGAAPGPAGIPGGAAQ